MSTKNIKFETHIKTISHIIKEKVQDISASEVVVAIGRAFKNEEEIALAREFAEAIGGVLASTRPLVESGLIDPKCQIGLSGKTVAPKLLITLGVSGQVQFTAGMRGSNLIISVNKDPNAPIFDVAHYGIVDDCFKIIPTLLQMIKKDSKEGED